MPWTTQMFNTTNVVFDWQTFVHPQNLFFSNMLLNANNHVASPFSLLKMLTSVDRQDNRAHRHIFCHFVTLKIQRKRWKMNRRVKYIGSHFVEEVGVGGGDFTVTLGQFVSIYSTKKYFLNWKKWKIDHMFPLPCPSVKIKIHSAQCVK